VTPRGWLLFGSLSLVWGTPYLFIKIAVDAGLTPGFIAWSRVIIGALVLLPLAIRNDAFRGLPIRWVFAFAVAEMFIPFPLVAFAEERISSSLTAILLASLPLIVVGLGVFFNGDERPTPLRLTGMIIGLAGVAALVGIDIGGGESEMIGAAAALVAALSFASAALIVKHRLTDHDPEGTVTAALAIAAVLFVPIGIAGIPAEAPHADAIAAVAALGVLCSAIAVPLFIRTVAEIGVSRTTVSTYVQPLVALALGVVILGESAGAGALVGMLLIIAGSWLSTDGRLPPALVARVPLPASKRRRERDAAG
jgi:drug/metabolite transporter (DMT)-like permease